MKVAKALLLLLFIVSCAPVFGVAHPLSLRRGLLSKASSNGASKASVPTTAPPSPPPAIKPTLQPTLKPSSKPTGPPSAKPTLTPKVKMSKSKSPTAKGPSPGKGKGTSAKPVKSGSPPSAPHSAPTASKLPYSKAPKKHKSSKSKRPESKSAQPISLSLPPSKAPKRSASPTPSPSEGPKAPSRPPPFSSKAPTPKKLKAPQSSKGPKKPKTPKGPKAPKSKSKKSKVPKSEVPKSMSPKKHKSKGPKSKRPKKSKAKNPKTSGPTRAPSPLPTASPTPAPTTAPSTGPTSRAPDPGFVCPDPGASHRQDILFESNSSADEKHQAVVVSMSGNGKRVAVLHQLADSSGVVVVYNEGEDGEWSQVGEKIPVLGPMQKEWWAFSPKMISLSGNGRVLAVASPYYNEAAGTARVDIFKWNQARGWEVYGDGPITGIVSPRFRMSVDLAYGGYAVAVGTDISWDDPQSGSVSLWIIGPLNNWVQMGEDLKAADDDETNFGFDISYSPDGNRIAVAFNKIVGNTLQGAVRVFSFYMNTWPQLGDDIDAGGAIALSYNGSVLLVRENTYSYDASTTSWSAPNPVRTRLPSGNLAVDIAHNGKRVIIGDPLRLINHGRAQVFDLIDGHWCKTIQLIGRDEFVNYGYSVSMSEDGTRYAVGAPYIQWHYDRSYWQVVQVTD